MPKKSKQKGPTDPYGVNKYFDGLPIIEARSPLRIIPNAKDISGAKKHDPSCCAFSQACKRMWGTQRVLFFGTVAYVELLDSHGEAHVERFIINSDGQKLIRQFDAGKKVKPRSVVLRPPGPTNTKKGIRATYRRLRDAERLGKKLAQAGKGKGSARPVRRPTNARIEVFRHAHA